MATFFSGYFVVKVLLTALIVAGISALAKQTTLLAAVLASLPLTSILALIWMQVEGQPAENMMVLSRQIFWLVIPSLLFFVVFPLLIRLQFSFYPALLLACFATAIAYGVTMQVLNHFNTSA